MEMAVFFMGCCKISAVLAMVVLCCWGGAEGVTTTEGLTTEGTPTALDSTHAATHFSESGNANTDQPITNNNNNDKSPSTDYLSSTDAYDDYSADYSADFSTDSTTHTTPTAKPMTAPRQPREGCSCTLRLAVAIPVSIIAGMILVFVPFRIYINQQLRTRRGRWSGASDRTTEKVLRQLNLDRLNELEKKQLHSNLKYVAQGDSVSILVTGPEEKSSQVYDQIRDGELSTANNTTERVDNVYQTLISETEHTNGNAAVLVESETSVKKEPPERDNNEAESEVMCTNAEDKSNDENDLASPLPSDLRARSEQQLYEVGRESAISSKELNFLTIENENFRSSAQ
ncbi:hypothetical protein MAR_012023 [Mya arenaria]|uniref:Uncharacterized protein n=1 Tax=Mya arenaria TaxID=6604 RepID=A0ABY7FYS6_MYAAR|nr:hypothetical protein MAR_012023 [Mya arenaria]